MNDTNRDDFLEARSLVAELLSTVDRLVDQQAMPDNFYEPVVDKATAFLARTTP